MMLKVSSKYQLCSYSLNRIPSLQFQNLVSLLCMQLRRFCVYNPVLFESEFFLFLRSVALRTVYSRSSLANSESHYFASQQFVVSSPRLAFLPADLKRGLLHVTK